MRNLFFLFALLAGFGAATLLASCGTAKKPVPSSKNKNRERSGEIKVVTVKPKEEHRPLQAKYAAKLGVKENSISNTRLYSFIDEWYGAPYKYGGKSREGVDCSGFTCILYRDVFNKPVSAPSYGLFEKCEPLSKNELREGDLVFFKINQNRISHVGVYLQNNKFVHASTKAGVIINDLDEPYYQKYFFKAGRMRGN